MGKRKAEAFLVFAAFLWGGTFVTIKLAINEIDPALFLLYRFSLATLATGILFRKEIWVAASEVPSLSIASFSIGLVAFLGYILQTVGLVYTTATQSGFITGCYVIFVPILQILIEKKMPSRQMFLAVLFVFLGLVGISQNGLEKSNLNHFSFSLGDALTLASAFFFALYIILVDIFSKKVSEKPLVFWQIFVLAFLSFVTLPLFGQSYVDLHFSFSKLLIISICYTGILATLGTNFIQTKYQKEVSPTRAGVIFGLEPVFSFLCAYFILGETLSAIGILGCGFVLLGTFYSAKRD